MTRAPTAEPPASDPMRYAIYVAPAPKTPLWRFGSAVLGYDAETGREVAQLVPPGWDADAFRALTEEPRRYGFHATLKAPFRVADGVEEAELISALNVFALRQASFSLLRLEVSVIGSRKSDGGFIALTEPEPTPALLALERATVMAFEPFRAALTEEEIARRRPDRLTERQRTQLTAFGYPHIFDDFRFHLTLTGRVPGPDLDRAAAALSALFAEHVPAGPAVVDQLALFRQAPGERFRIVTRACLGTA